jgi:Tol biopolymer transport system component
VLWKRLTEAWQSNRLYFFLAGAIAVFVIVSLLVPEHPGYVPPSTATPLPTLLPGSVVRLTKNPDRDVAPAWSPDGERIAFCRYHHRRALHVMNADGTDITQLAQLPYATHEISWSPDGEQITYASGGIYVIGAHGGDPIELEAYTNYVVNREPAWSPDGTRIAFISDRDGTFDLYIATVTDRLVTRVTDNHAWTQHLAWSPDGRHIAFHSTRDGNVAIYTLDVACVTRQERDPACLARLTDTATENREPAWSPDGTFIAFTSMRDGNLEIYVMGADGGRQTRLTNSPDADRLPAWSPDGTHIAFLSTPDLRDVHNDVYVVQPDGSGSQRLTNDGLVSSFAWSPDSRHIAFVSYRDDRITRLCSPCNNEIYVVSIN